MEDKPASTWDNSMPEAYERLLGPAMFHPWAVDMAKRVAARSPQSVLELAAGTGIVTRELTTALPSAAITATDLNVAMVELGRTLASNAKWQQADAMSIPFDSGEFDVVACQFGAMFFPDKPTAFAEARRVLKTGGVFILNTWGTAEQQDLTGAIDASLRRMFPDDPPSFITSVPHGYADTDLVAADLRAGGFENISIESLTLECHTPSAAEFGIGLCTGTPVRAELVARGDLETATNLVAKDLEAQFGTQPVAGKMVAHVIEAS